MSVVQQMKADMLETLSSGPQPFSLTQTVEPKPLPSIPTDVNPKFHSVPPVPIDLPEAPKPPSELFPTLSIPPQTPEPQRTVPSSLQVVNDSLSSPKTPRTAVNTMTPRNFKTPRINANAVSPDDPPFMKYGTIFSFLNPKFHNICHCILTSCLLILQA
jgi:hypothetical protein